MSFDHYLLEAKYFKISPPSLQQLYTKWQKKGACSAYPYCCRRFDYTNGILYKV